MNIFIHFFPPFRNLFAKSGAIFSRDALNSSLVQRVKLSPDLALCHAINSPGLDRILIKGSPWRSRGSNSGGISSVISPLAY